MFSGDEHSVYYKYYAISLFWILFWGGVLYLKDEIRINTSISFIGIIIGLYFVEFTLQFIDYSPQTDRQKRLFAAYNLGIEFDKRSNLK